MSAVFFGLKYCTLTKGHKAQPEKMAVKYRVNDFLNVGPNRMKNYHGFACTNTFGVKDETAFLVALQAYPQIQVIKRGDKFMLVCEKDNVEFVAETAEVDGAAEVDIPGIVAHHLRPNETALFVETATEGMRYLSGYAIAIDSQGWRCAVGFDHVNSTLINDTSPLQPFQAVPEEER